MKYRTSIFRPLALTFLMAVPFGFGVGFLAVGIYEGWREFKDEVLEIEGWAVYENHSLGFLADGTPVVRDNKSIAGGQWQDQHSRLDGTPIALDERDEILHPQRLRRGGNRRRHPFDREPFADLLSHRNRWWGFRDPEKNSIQWTWEPVRNSSTDRILVARYQSGDAAVWFATPDGFLPGTPKVPDGVSGFDRPENWIQDEEMVGFLTEGKLTAINLADRTVSTITDVDVSRQAWAMFKQNEESGWHFVIQTSNALTVYSDQGKLLLSHTTEDSAGGLPSFYTPTGGGFIVTHVESRDEERLPGLGRRYRADVVATWLDDSGAVTRTLNFRNEYRHEPKKSSSVFVSSVDWFMESIGPGLVAPELAVMCGSIFVLVPWVSSSMSPERSASEAIEEVLAEIPYAIPVSAIVGLICAIFCWRRQVRYQADWTKTWVVFVFLFGLPAWIAWRVHRRWPPLEIATVSETGFVAPEPNGLEIR